MNTDISDQNQPNLIHLALRTCNIDEIKKAVA